MLLPDFFKFSDDKKVNLNALQNNQYGSTFISVMQNSWNACY